MLLSVERNVAVGRDEPGPIVGDWSEPADRRCGVRRARVAKGVRYRNNCHTDNISVSESEIVSQSRN